MYIDASNDATTDLSTYLNTIDDSTSTIKGHFRISKKTDENAFALYTITSLTDNTGWFSVASSYVSGNSTFANSDDIIVTFQRTGDKGDTGLTGATGSAGTNGTDGATGSAGTAGATGAAGASGVGTAGATGVAGASGVGGGASAGSTGFNGVLFVGATGPSFATNGTLSVSGPASFTGGGVQVGTTGPTVNAGQLAVQTYLILGSTGLTGATGSFVATASGQFGQSLWVGSGFATPGATGEITATKVSTASIGASGIQVQTLAIGATGGAMPTSGSLYVSGPSFFNNSGVLIGTTGPNVNAGQLGVQTYIILGSTGLTGATGSFVATGTGQVGQSLWVGSGFATPGATGQITATSVSTSSIGASGIQVQTLAIGASGGAMPTSGSLYVSGPSFFNNSGVTIGSTGPTVNIGQLAVQTGLILGSTGLTGATGSFVATGDGQVGKSLWVGSGFATPGATGGITATSVSTASLGASGIQVQTLAIGASGGAMPTSGSLYVSGPSFFNASGVTIGSTGPNLSPGQLSIQQTLIIGATGIPGATGSFVATGTGQVGTLWVGGGIATMGATGEIRATADVTAYYSSDARLKENITTIDNALSKLRRLKGVMFDWKDDVMAGKGGEDGYFVRKHDTGVIAQEVEAVLPEVVADRADGFKAVRYEKLAGLIIQAINELADQVDALKK